MADETKRIIDQDADTSLSAGDYVVVDSQAEGTRKFDLGSELSGIKADLQELEGGGLSDDAKAALLACFRHIAFLDDDDDYYQDLYDALYPPAPPATLTSITCVYTQSGTVYDTDTLDSLKTDLIVTAHYDNGTTQTVTAYTLSGTLTVGTSTITVSYNGKTTTFNVTVSEYAAEPIYDWDLKTSLTDSVNGVTASTTGTFTSGTGIVLNDNNQYCDFGTTYGVNRTYEIDMDEFGDNTSFGSQLYRRLFMVDTDANTSSGGAGLILGKGTRSGWWAYLGSSWDSTAINEGSYDSVDGKTVKVYVDSSSKLHVYTKNIGDPNSSYVLFGESTGAIKSFTNGHIYVGSSTGDYVQPLTISGLRIYEGEV